MMNSLRLHLLYILTLFTVLSVFASGNEFDEVHVGGACELHIVCRPDSAGRLIRNASAGDVAVDYSSGGSSLFITVMPESGSSGLAKLTLYVGQELRVVEVSGRAKVYVQTIKSSGAVALVSSGAASLTVGSVTATNINVSLSGSGKIAITDALTASTLNFSAMGSGKIQADAITATRMTVTQRGSGKLMLVGSAHMCSAVERGSGTIDLRNLVSGKFDFKLFGSGRIYYTAGVPVTTSGDTERIIQVKPYQPL